MNYYYKVLIADDEYWAREKIRTMLDWKEYGLECLEPAIDGEDVLAKIEEYAPDIVITDINMPFMNGVDLINIMKTKYPEIITFVISGYDDFEYVRNTFMAGAIHYLIKPVNKIDLVNALSRSLEIISERQEQNLQLLKAASLIQDKEFSFLVEQEEAPFTPTITMNQNMNFAGYSLVLIKFHDLAELSKRYKYDMNLLSYSVKKELKKLVNCEKLIIFNHIYRSNEFIMITDMDNQSLKIMTDKMLVKFPQVSNSPMSIIISEHSYSLDSIHSAYIQTIATFMTRDFTRENVVLTQDSQQNSEKTDVKNYISQEKEKQFKNYLINRNWNSLKEFIFEVIGIAECETQKWGYLEVKQTVKRIYTILVDYKIEDKAPEDVINIEYLGELADKTVETLNEEKLCEILEETLRYVSGIQKEECSDSIKSVVKQIVEYIDNYYFEEITLLELSKQFGIEHSYLSKMFRQETGENLILYITKKRMDKAKEYMNDQKHKLTEIAFMVGYDDYTYFNRVFRKIVGKSPREYKNSIR